VIEFRVLGPLEAVGPSGAAALGAGKQRLLLAMLVLRAGEVVARSAIIDGLWAEDPPASAAQSVESYVSRLRAALRAAGATQPILASAPGGYRLLRDGNRFDRDAFTELANQARIALEDGDAREASALAGAALALWHGPALAGISQERVIWADAAALEDLRLQALETRAQAQLTIGDHVQVIAELRAEATRHPERERVHELLMLALYRAGRQADALQVYRDARAQLDRDLGLAPGPALRELEGRILRHDPTLDGPPATIGSLARAAPARAAPGRRRRLVRIGLPAVLVVMLAVVGLGLLLAGAGAGTGDATVARTLRSAALGLLDVRSGQPRAAVALGVVPSRITAGLGSDWATSYDNGTLLRIDPSKSAVVQTVHVGHGATGVAVDAGDVWVADTLGNQLTRVNASSDRVVQRIRVGTSPGDVAAGAGAVWVANTGGGTVSRVDPLTGGVTGVTRVGPSPSGIAIGDGSVWVALGGAAAVARLDSHTGQLQQTIPVGSGPSAITVGRGGVWVANERDSTVSLIDPTSNSVVLTREVAGAPSALTVSGPGVLVAANTPSLTRIGKSGQTRAIAIPSPAVALASGPRGVLVGVTGLGVDHRGGTLVVRSSQPIGQIDPQECCNTPPAVEMLSYDSLLAYSKSPASPDTLVPDLALAIPAAQDGGLSYTFRLRRGLRYWTGAPIRASDFRRGLERAAESSGIYAAYLGALPGALSCPGRASCDLRSAVITNDRAGTITLHLSHPDPDLLPALGLPAFAPAPTGGGVTPGTGPYRVFRFVPGKMIEFTRNPYFTDWAPTAQPAGYPNRILVHSDGTALSDIAAVLQGRADYTFDTPSPRQLRKIELRDPAQLHTDPLPDTDMLTLNTREAPFDDLRARRALNMAINRDTIARLYGGLALATPTCQIIPATIPGHVPYCPYTRDPTLRGQWTAPDLERARQLAAASGTRGEPVTLLTEAPAGYPGEAPVGRYTVGVLRALGYRARLRVVQPSQFQSASNDYRHPPQIVTNSWVANLPSPSEWITIKLSCAAQYPPLLNNMSDFCDHTVDNMAARASQLQLTDPAAADRLWARADRTITNLAPWVPTVTAHETDLVSARVGNYQYVPTIGGLIDQLWVR
jgi:peptide/nickel transport system substrate-binding protein